MPPDPKITTVAELEPYGLNTRSMVILDELGFVTLKDMEEATEEYILSHKNSAAKTVENIQEALRNYLAGPDHIARTKHDMWFPKRWPKKTRKKK